MQPHERDAQPRRDEEQGHDGRAEQHGAAAAFPARHAYGVMFVGMGQPYTLSQKGRLPLQNTIISTIIASELHLYERAFCVRSKTRTIVGFHAAI